MRSMEVLDDLNPEPLCSKVKRSMCMWARAGHSSSHNVTLRVGGAKGIDERVSAPMDHSHAVGAQSTRTRHLLHYTSTFTRPWGSQRTMASCWVYWTVVEPANRQHDLPHSAHLSSWTIPPLHDRQALGIRHPERNAISSTPARRDNAERGHRRAAVSIASLLHVQKHPCNFHRSSNPWSQFPPFSSYRR